MNKLHHNNLFFGDRSKLVRVEPPAERLLAADEVGVPVRLYIAQHNFVDAEPSGNSLPLLPGQAMDLTPATPLVYKDVTVAPGSTFQNLLVTAQDANFINTLAFDSYDGAIFLSSFNYNGETYDSIQTAEYTLEPGDPPLTDPLLNTMWTGWGITYFNGIHRPQRFETYPALAINQYLIYPNIDDSRLDFTLDFTKVQTLYFI
jgi:hypothetical protein